MKHHRVFSILVLVAALVLGQASVFGASPDFPTAFVVDPCRAYTPEPGECAEWTQTAELRMMDLSGASIVDSEIDWEYSLDEFSGVAFPTVPSYEKKYIFATRGSELVVYDVFHRLWREDYVEDPEMKEHFSFDEVGVVDLAEELHLPGLQLGRIAAGNWYLIEVQPGVLVPQAALYIVGALPDNDEAYYFVIDQESLLPPEPFPTQWDPAVTVYGQDQICFWSNCAVSSVLDIRVGDVVEGPDYVEEAYITFVQHFSVSTALQLTYRLERFFSGSDFSSEVVHISYFEAPHAGVDPPFVKEASGLGFAPDSHDAYVPRKDNWKIENLVSGSESCALPAEPTDVAVWQPASSGVRYLLVTTYDGLTGRLYVTPADGCADPQNPFVLDVALGNRPTSLDLHTYGDNQATIVVVGEGYEEFQSIHLTYNGTTGSFVSSIEGISLATQPIGESCPSYVHLGLRSVLEVDPHAEPFCDCDNPDSSCKKGGKDRDCLPADLRCNISPRPPAGSDE